MKKNKVRKAALICLILALLVVNDAAIGYISWERATTNAQHQLEADKKAYIDRYQAARSTTYQRVAESWTKSLSAMEAEVVFFGDSITADGLWDEYYPYLSIVNLGVVGDTTDGLLTRMKQVEVLCPFKCFLMIGVNDLINGMEIEDILIRYRQLLDELTELSGETGLQIYVQSVLPVLEGTVKYPVYNEDIRLLNAGIEQLAAEYDVPYIDVYALMAGEDGMLQEKYSEDGLHVNELAYWEWQELLIPYIDE